MLLSDNPSGRFNGRPTAAKADQSAETHRGSKDVRCPLVLLEKNRHSSSATCLSLGMSASRLQQRTPLRCQLITPSPVESSYKQTIEGVRISCHLWFPYLLFLASPAQIMFTISEICNTTYDPHTPTPSAPRSQSIGLHLLLLSNPMCTIHCLPCTRSTD